MQALPTTIHSGDTIEVQLAPFGEYSALLEGKPIVQQCDAIAFAQVVANFSSEILVDFEHHAENGGDTDAAAWVQSLRVDPSAGLLATFKVTDIGAEAIAQRRLRFLSPAWTLDAHRRPEYLISVGLTNKPNIPVRPLLNRAPTTSTSVEQKEGKTMKEQLIALLGCAPDASDQDIVDAVQALTETAAKAAEEALNAEAEAAAEENKDKICNRSEFIRFYCKNRDAAKKMFALLKQPSAPAPICNRSAAQIPAPLSASTHEDTVLNTWQSMPEGDQKNAYLIANKDAIATACTLHGGTLRANR
ncbi:MAG: phage protease [Pygmaiobacter sp.]